MIKKFNDGRDWFFEKRLGLFVHWGLYAIPGWHEQLQWRGNVTREEYGKLIAQFNPTTFNPDEWLDLAQEAGMEYLCFTTKHHDGFCMWDTEQTDFNIMNTPYQKDIVRMLADACHKRDFPFCLYYSVVDWHHPNYPNQGRSHEIQPQAGDSPHMEKYVEYLKAQIRELCTNYGKIAGIWWDMNTAYHCDPSVHKMIRELQPQAVINDRGFDTGIRGIGNGDFTTPERELPPSKCFEVPTEACQSLGVHAWGYKKDEDFFSDKFIMQSIDQVLAMGGNYLLNIGPKADGSIENKVIGSIKKIGNWYKSVKESFAAEPVAGLIGNSQIMMNRVAENLYIHLNPDHNCSALDLKPIKFRPQQVILLNNGLELEWVVDTDVQTWHSAVESLKIRKIPVNAMNDQVMVIKVKL